MIPQLLLQGAKAFLGRDLTPKGLQVARQLGTQLQNGFQQAQAQMAQQKPMQGPKEPSKEEIMGADESTLDNLLSSFFPKASAEENPFTAANRALEMADNPFSQVNIEIDMEENLGNALSGMRDFQSNYQPEKNFFEKAGDTALEVIGGVGRGLNEASQPIAKGIGKLIGREPAPVEVLSGKSPGTLASSIGEGLGTAASMIPAFIGGGAAATGARGLAAKAIPALEKAGTVGKSILGAVEGAGAALGFNAEQAVQNLSTEGATSGVGASAAIGAVLPWAGGFIRAGQKFLGKNIPERIYKGAIKLTPTQKKEIARIAGENAEEFLLRNGITGSADEIVNKLDEIASASKKQKVSSLITLDKTFKSDDALNLADDLIKNLEDAPGQKLAEKLKFVKDVRKSLESKGVSLAEMDELKSIWDKYGTKVVYGSTARDSAKAVGLKDIREGVKKFIEDEAERLGVPIIKDLNKTTQIAREISNAVGERAVAAGGNQILTGADILLGGGVGLGTLAYDPEDPLGSLVNIGLAVGAKKFLQNPATASRLANVLYKMNPDKANRFFRFLQGERAGLNKKQAEEFKKIVENVSIKKAP